MKTTKTEVTTDLVITKSAGAEKQILLIQRRNEPHKNKWALPGGFVETDEEVIAGAMRELKEETGIQVSKSDLHFIGYFDKPDRDPRGRIISFAFAAKVPANTKVKASDDAKNAQWFSVNDLPDLAFDHASIIKTSLML